MRKIGEVNDLFKLNLNMELNGELIPSVKIGSKHRGDQRESQVSEERKIMNKAWPELSPLKLSVIRLSDMVI